MFAAVRDTRLFFDVEGASLVPDGAVMRERPVALRDPWRARRRPLRVQALVQPARGAHAAGLFRPSRPGPLGAVIRHATRSTRTSRTWRRCAGISASGRSSASARRYGGMVAMAHAARYPDAVSHLVLIVTAAHGGFIPRAQQIVARARHPRTTGASAICCGRASSAPPSSCSTITR